MHFILFSCNYLFCCDFLISILGARPYFQTAYNLLPFWVMTKKIQKNIMHCRVFSYSKNLSLFLAYQVIYNLIYGIGCHFFVFSQLLWQIWSAPWRLVTRSLWSRKSILFSQMLEKHTSKQKFHEVSHPYIIVSVEGDPLEALLEYTFNNLEVTMQIESSSNDSHDFQTIVLFFVSL